MTGQAEGSSFRDSSSRVFEQEDSYTRVFSPEAFELHQRLREDGRLTKLEESGIVSSELSASESKTIVTPAIRPLIYPYEWSFEMLRSAALHCLDLQLSLLKLGLSLKDASSFNTVFEGARPVHVDLGSFEEYQEGSLWKAQGQFSRSYLFPLLVQSTRGIAFQKILQADLGELDLDSIRPFFSWRDSLHRGVFTHILLASFLQRTFSGREGLVEKSLQDLKLPKKKLLSSLESLRGLILNLRNPLKGQWETYAEEHSYDEEWGKKKEFISRILSENQPRSLVDLGCNTGEMTEVGLSYCGRVVGFDIDPQAIDRFFLRFQNKTSKLYLGVCDLAKPSPELGFMNTERKALIKRIEGDLWMALALVHHLRISAGVPIELQFKFFSQLAPEMILEWVGKEDDMVQSMIKLREDIYSDLEWEAFEKALTNYFRIESSLDLKNGRRKLLYLKRIS